MALKPPFWGNVPQTVPAKVAGYHAAQDGASIPPAMRKNPTAQQSSNNSIPPSSAPTSMSMPQGQQNAQMPTTRQAPAPQQAPRKGDTQKRTAAQSDAKPGPIKFRSRSGYTGIVSESISRKICKVNAKDKVVDFTSKLNVAYVNDYAMIHGCGGKDHAGNSTIGITICDYTNGTGDNKSVTVKYSLDVKDISQLYEAAMFARLGILKPDASMNITWINTVERQINDWKRYQPTQDGIYPIPRNALNALFGTIQNAKAATNAVVGTPCYIYQREKNNPYAVQNGLAPCSKVTISFSPYRKDGDLSHYPWYISVENFDAPLNTSKSGASSHNSKQAVNKRSAFINLSCDDFCAVMTAIQRHVHQWENYHSRGLFTDAYCQMEEQRRERSAQNDNGATATPRINHA